MDEQRAELIRQVIQLQAEHLDYINQPRHELCSYDGLELMEIL